MTQPVSPYEQWNDSFGYAVYSVVVFADHETRERVQAVRGAVAAQRAMMPAHVTVKGTFCRINDLDEIKTAVSDIALATDPFEIEFAGGASQTFGGADHQFGFQGIQVTPDLKALHMSLYDSLSPVSTRAYGSEGENYRPHLTVYAEPAPDRVDLANDLVSRLDLGAGFTANSMRLMGHVGRPYSGEWKLIKEFDFRNPTAQLE